MFSMFATAEEVTKTGLGEEEQDVQATEAKETDEVKVRVAKCCSAFVLHLYCKCMALQTPYSPGSLRNRYCNSFCSHAHLFSDVIHSAEVESGTVVRSDAHV